MLVAPLDCGRWDVSTGKYMQQPRCTPLLLTPRLRVLTPASFLSERGIARCEATARWTSSTSRIRQDVLGLDHHSTTLKYDDYAYAHTGKASTSIHPIVICTFPWRKSSTKSKEPQNLRKGSQESQSTATITRTRHARAVPHVPRTSYYSGKAKNPIGALCSSILFETIPNGISSTLRVEQQA